MTKPWGFFKSLLLLSPLLVSVPIISIRKHYALPEPLVDLYDPVSNTPQLSEARILAYAQYLSEDIGFRTVGTREHAQADVWMVQQADRLREMCEDAVRKEPGRKLECEVWRQAGSGSHRFDLLQKRLYKTYVNLTNIIVRISDGTPTGKEHALLMNAHLDSTLPSPGAADDALSVGVMLEAARILIETPGWSPTHALILLFNNAEESLQDGSHLFATQHPIRNTVRAVVNLEAAGSTGPELLFQATSAQMLDAYAHVPRPYGTVVANDVFSSGIIGSDTDFRQFELYLNVTGLDMAVVGHSYFYHTRKDLVEYIEPGVAQHMGENALALLRYLSAPGSPLPELTTGYSRPTTMFFSLLNSVFIQYSFTTANALHAVLLTASLLLVALTAPTPEKSTFVTRREKREVHATKGGANFDVTVSESTEVVTKTVSIWGEQLKGILLISASFLGALVNANVVAFLMAKVFDRSLSWYRVEYSCLLLYGPAALAGALGVLCPLSQLFRTSERSLVTATLLAYASLAVIVQLASIGSAAVFFLSGCSLFAGLLLNRGSGPHVSLVTYAVGQLVPLLLGTEVFCAVSDIFVPLTGRMGADAPGEFIIASIVVFTSSYFLPLALPFFHRFGSRFLLRSFIISSLLTGAMMLVFAMREPFDAMHPKRVYILHSENITTNEVSLNIAACDPTPKFDTLVDEIAALAGKSDVRATAVDMHEYNGDWDVLYPFAAFLAPYKVELEPQVSSWANGQFTVKAVDNTIDEVAMTRSLKIIVYHPGLIWTTIAFDAYVLSWSLDNNPPAEYARHFIKEASFYGEDTWSVDLVISLDERHLPDVDPESSPESQLDGKVDRRGELRVNFVGVKEATMWPGKKAEYEENVKRGVDEEHRTGGRIMRLFEELDTWLETRTNGAVDATLVGCVGGVSVL